jgi:hypothetical protein
MAIIVVPNLTLLPQDKSNACWYFSAKMVHKWASANGKQTVKDPANVKTDRLNLQGLYESNAGYATSTCIELSACLGLKALSKSQRGFDEFKTLLAKGPIFAAGAKGGADGSFHVVVIGGVADTGLLIFDPLPMRIGAKVWRTWDWMDGFFDISNSRIDANLLVIA